MQKVTWVNRCIDAISGNQARLPVILRKDNSPDGKIVKNNLDNSVLDLLNKQLTQKYPGLQLVLTIHGYQPLDLWPQLEQQILQMQPDLVLVALGIPRQETWIQRLHQGQPGLWMGVGGSFDVWSGQKKRAPNWMGTLQIEWLYRLVQEPSRWRRMLALPQFAFAVLSGNPPKPAKQKQAAEKTKE